MEVGCSVGVGVCWKMLGAAAFVWDKISEPEGANAALAYGLHMSSAKCFLSRPLSADNFKGHPKIDLTRNSSKSGCPRRYDLLGAHHPQEVLYPDGLSVDDCRMLEDMFVLTYMSWTSLARHRIPRGDEVNLQGSDEGDNDVVRDNDKICMND